MTVHFNLILILRINVTVSPLIVCFFVECARSPLPLLGTIYWNKINSTGAPEICEEATEEIHIKYVVGYHWIRMINGRNTLTDNLGKS